MKKIALIGLFLLAGTWSFSQQYKDYSKIPLKTADDCKKAEPEILEAANLVLKSPLDDVNGILSMAFIVVWMENSEHTF